MCSGCGMASSDRLLFSAVSGVIWCGGATPITYASAPFMVTRVSSRIFCLGGKNSL